MTARTAAVIDNSGEDRAAFAAGAAFVDGAYVPIAEAKISVLDWGFLRSDATYDVVHVWDGRFFRLDHHLDRFERSMARLRLTAPHDRAEIVAILMRLVGLTGYRDAYVEVLCTRGLPPRGSRDPRLCENRFMAFVIPFVWIVDKDKCTRGLDLHVSTIPRIPPQSVDPTVKNYHWMDLTNSLFEAYDCGCDLAVLLDQDGDLAEGPGFNIFVVRDGTVTTPGGTCLEGITRQTALDLLGALNVTAVVGPVGPAALRAADEAFITSTAGGIIPITRVDGAAIADGEVGPLVSRLRDLYWQRHGEAADTTPVVYD